MRRWYIMSENSSVLPRNNIDVRLFTFEAFRLALKALQENSDLGIQGNQVIVLTNFGQIICDLDSKESIGEIIAKNILRARDSAIKNFSPETSLDCNNEMLLLKNVVIIPFSNPQVRLNYNVITVFADQIVGFSIGKLSCN